jgi:hypothetical protein
MESFIASIFGGHHADVAVTIPSQPAVAAHSEWMSVTERS